MTRALLAPLAVITLAACVAPAGAPPPPVVTVPARASVAPVAASSAPSSPPAPLVARAPEDRCEHRDGAAVVDALLAALSARDAGAVRDCLSPSIRGDAGHAATAHARRLLDAGAQVTVSRALSVRTSISFVDGVKTATFSRTVELLVAETPPTTRTVTVTAEELAGRWFVVDVRDGAPEPDPTFGALFGAPPTEADSTVVSRTGEHIVVSVAHGAPLPAPGAQVDLLRRHQPPVRAGATAHTTLVGVAHGKVVKVNGRRVQVRVEAWTARAAGADPAAPGGALVMQWRTLETGLRL